MITHSSCCITACEHDLLYCIRNGKKQQPKTAILNSITTGKCTSWGSFCCCSRFMAVSLLLLLVPGLWLLHNRNCLLRHRCIPVFLHHRVDSWRPVDVHSLQAQIKNTGEKLTVRSNSRCLPYHCYLCHFLLPWPSAITCWSSTDTYPVAAILVTFVFHSHQL